MSKPLHQIKSCQFCDDSYELTMSDAETPTLYCSQDCEVEYAKENEPAPSRVYDPGMVRL